MFNTELLSYLEGFLTDDRKERFLEVLSKRTTYLTVAVEDVFQFHNTSAILRSCDAFGIQEVYTIEDRFGDRLDKNIAMGAQQWVDVYRYQTTAECIDKLKQEGYSIIATVPHSQAQSVADFELHQKAALFFGTEREGLSEEVLQQADAFITVPMVGFSESLNVSVSAAILLEQLSNKLRNSTLPWQLTPVQVLDKRLDWTKKSIKNVEQIISRYQGN